MSITFHEDGRMVHIRNKKISYIMKILDGKYLTHCYFGRRLREYHDNRREYFFKKAYTTTDDLTIENVSMDDIGMELPVRGRGDFRIPALSVVAGNGIEYVDLHFKEWKVLEEKQKIQGMPSTFGKNGEVETLEIICEDKIAKISFTSWNSEN